MVLDEQHLRQQLKATADRVQAPSFKAADFAGRIQRRRAKVLGLASGLLLAVAAVAVAVPATLSYRAQGGALSLSPMVASRLSFTVAVNGQSGARSKNTSPAVFTIPPGKRLHIKVGVLVQAHAKVTNLWLGFTTGTISGLGPDGQRPAGLRPVLVHIAGPLTQGPHTFKLAWRMPAHLPRGGSVLLVAEWRQPDVGTGSFIAQLVPPPGSVISAAQACRLVVGRTIPEVSFSGVERVRLVLTRYARNNPIEFTHDEGNVIPLRTLVWVIEVHAKAIGWLLPYPLPGHRKPARPDTDFSVVMNARTTVLGDFGESNHWPLPLSKLGQVISLPPRC